MKLFMFALEIFYTRYGTFNLLLTLYLVLLLQLKRLLWFHYGYFIPQFMTLRQPPSRYEVSGAFCLTPLFNFCLGSVKMPLLSHCLPRHFADVPKDTEAFSESENGFRAVPYS